MSQAERALQAYLRTVQESQQPYGEEDPSIPNYIHHLLYNLEVGAEGATTGLVAAGIATFSGNIDANYSVDIIRDIKVNIKEVEVGRNNINLHIDFNIKQDPNTLASVQLDIE